MYLFKEAYALVANGELTLDFWHSGESMDFGASTKVADQKFLQASVNQIYSTLKSKRNAVIPLTSPNSFLRGYQGGLLQVVENRTTKGKETTVNHSILVTRRSLDAKTCPGRLDICAGRTMEGEQQSWAGVVLSEGFEEIAILNSGLQVPKILGIYADFTEYCQKKAGEATKDADIAYLSKGMSFVEIFPPENAATVTIHKDKTSIPETYWFGWVAMPKLSSIELYAYAKNLGLPDKVRYFDTEKDQGIKLDREIYEINKKNGIVQVWQSGKVKEARSLEELLERSKKIDQVEEPVSPKLKAAIANWPVEKLGDPETLKILLDY
ncbi:MAG: hypothetical protein V1837_05130 [Candidatus Woesearchaeota archaeon]